MKAFVRQATVVKGRINKKAIETMLLEGEEVTVIGKTVTVPGNETISYIIKDYFGVIVHDVAADVLVMAVTAESPIELKHTS